MDNFAVLEIGEDSGRAEQVRGLDIEVHPGEHFYHLPGPRFDMQHLLEQDSLVPLAVISNESLPRPTLAQFLDRPQIFHGNRVHDGLIADLNRLHSDVLAGKNVILVERVGQ